jgi:hypothetical protein
MSGRFQLNSRSVKPSGIEQHNSTVFTTLSGVYFDPYAPIRSSELPSLSPALISDSGKLPTPSQISASHGGSHQYLQPCDGKLVARNNLEHGADSCRVEGVDQIPTEMYLFGEDPYQAGAREYERISRFRRQRAFSRASAPKRPNGAFRISTQVTSSPVPPPYIPSSPRRVRPSMADERERDEKLLNHSSKDTGLSNGHRLVLSKFSGGTENTMEFLEDKLAEDNVLFDAEVIYSVQRVLIYR